MQKQEINEIISLGPNCQTAGVIKILQYKKTSYPFDWVLSNLKIVSDCLLDDFNKYLDKSLYYKNKNNNWIGHGEYLSNMFVHRNPLIEEDYSYHKRCVERFLNLKDERKNILFIHTVYNTHYPELEWQPRLNEEFISDLDNIKNILNMHFEKYQFLLINYVKVEEERNYEILFENGHIRLVIYLKYDNSIEYSIDDAIDSFFKANNPIEKIFDINLK